MHHILGLVISVMRYLTDTPRHYAGAADGPRDITRCDGLRDIAQCEADGRRNNPGVTDREISRSVTDRKI